MSISPFGELTSKEQPSLRTYLTLLTLASSAIFFCFSIVWTKSQPESIVEFDHPGPKIYRDTWVVGNYSSNVGGVDKYMILVNGQFPGPTVNVNTGDTVEITVVNDLDSESTSVHWHGLHQMGSNHMDGAPGITQCGIPPGGNLTYTFKVEQSGTYWWHSHHETQRTDGMFGMLVAHDEEHDAYSSSTGAYDEELNIILSDLYFESGEYVLEYYLSRMSGGMEPVPDNALINGHGVFDCDKLLSEKERCKPNAGRLAEFDFKEGKNYRLRVLNAAAMAQFEFSLDNHELKVIEADGIEIEPEVVHYLPISSGQRYSVIVEANKKSSSGFLMRAKVNTKCFNYLSLYLEPEIKAIVNYTKSSSKWFQLAKRWLEGNVRYYFTMKKGYSGAGKGQRLPKTTSWRDTIPEMYCLDLVESKIRPLKKETVPPADVTVLLNSKIMKFEKRNLAPFGFFNRTSWQPAIGAPNLLVDLGFIDAASTVHVPPIIGLDENTEKWGGHQLVADVPYNAVVELIINNGDEVAHPFHLHGHDVWLLNAYQPQHQNGQWTPASISDYRLDNPVKRDTITVPRFGHAVVRFRANNPGIWAFHCHIAWHVTTGMMMQFRSGADQIQSLKPLINPTMLQHCEYERALGKAMLKPLPGSEYE